MHSTPSRGVKSYTQLTPKIAAQHGIIWMNSCGLSTPKTHYEIQYPSIEGCARVGNFDQRPRSRNICCHCRGWIWRKRRLTDNGNGQLHGQYTRLYIFCGGNNGQRRTIHDRPSKLDCATRHSGNSWLHDRFNNGHDRERRQRIKCNDELDGDTACDLHQRYE